MKQPLTKKQKEWLDFLNDFYLKNGYMPSHEELADHFGILLGGSTEHHLWALEKKGWIRRKKGRARYITIL